MRAGRGRLLGRVLLLVGVALGLPAIAATPAAAHASLVDADPADGAELDAAPERVVFEFNEAVRAPTGGLRVFDAAGSRVDAGAGDVEARPEAVAVEIGRAGELGAGTYIATYRVTSADGHPVKGATVFSVGAAGEVDDALLGELLGDDAGWWAGLAGAGRAVQYAAVLLAAGGAAFLRWAHRGGDADERPRLTRLVWRASLVGIVAAVAGVGLQAGLVSGLGPAALASADALGETVAGWFGAGSGLRALALAALAAAAHAASRHATPLPGWALLAAGAAVGSFLLVGHSLTAQPRWLMVAGDAAHLAAAAVWLGGLGCLAVVLRSRRRRDDPVGAADMVAGFSRMAAVAVAALGASGLAMAWVQVRALRALTGTPYGWVLLAKVVVVLAVVALAAYNRRRLVPAVAAAAEPRPATAAGRAVPAGGANGAARAADVGWARLGRTVRVEAAGLGVVVVLTAFLVNLQPAADAAGITGVFSTYEPLGGDHEINLVVDPNRAGSNQIHLYVLDASGRPADDLGDDVVLRFTKPDEDIGPVERDPHVVGPGHWLHAGPELSIPGRWHVEVVVRASEFEDLRAEVPVTVNP